MTRKEIIVKGEKVLQLKLDKLEKSENSGSNICTIAREGLAHLDMLFLILDEEYENYNYWFNKFYQYI